MFGMNAINARIPRDLWKRIQAAAAVNRRSATMELISILENAMPPAEPIQVSEIPDHEDAHPS
jgi:hypothetical protein